MSNRLSGPDSSPNLFRRREQTARVGSAFLASAAAARHRCGRGAHRGLSLAPTLTTDDGVWYAVPAHITGDIASPTFASTRRKDHAAGLAAQG